MFGFSGKLLITNIFNHINNNLFSVILGKYYSKIEVGYYNQSNKWCGMGQQFILGMINGVAQPVLAKISEDTDRQQRVFRKMLRFTAFISFPAMLGLGIIAEELIVISITDKWYSSVSIMQILCISGAFVPIANLYQQLIISKGKSRIFMWNIIILGMLLLTGVLLVHSYGIYAMLAMYVSTNILWLLRWHHFVQLEIGLKLRHALADILPYAIIAASVMAVTYYTARPIENIYVRLASKILLAMALYAAAMWASRSVTFESSTLTETFLAEDVDGLFVWDNTPMKMAVLVTLYHTYNTHRLPSWKALMKDKKLPKTKLMKWKLKATCKNITGETLAFLTYKKPVLLNCHLKFDPNQHFHIPELGIDGDYLHAFRKMTEITWKLNEVTGRECRHLADNLQLPQEYVGCQIRGGDKITETNLLPAEYYIRLIKQKTDLRDVFVLTDDYRIFRQVQSLAPDIRWYTLCDSGEKGYVNSAFTQTTKELKQKQMTRFLSSIQLLMNASIFTGSITTGPSLFLLKKFYPDISPADCLLEDFPQAATLPIPGRSQMAAEFLQGNLKL